MEHELAVFVVFACLHIATGQDDCHCLNKTHCPYNCNSQCDSGWLGTSCVTQNIALNKTAFQSSTGHICSTACTSLPASLAVDGDTRTDRGAQCSRTAEQRTTASLTVSFQHLQLIDRVGLYFSEETVPASFAVVVGDFTCYSQAPPSPTPPREFSFTCPTPLQGDRVRIIRQDVGRMQLKLCEVEIYECVNGFYSTNCGHKCYCQGGEICDKSDGTCYNASKSTSPTTSLATTTATTTTTTTTSTTTTTTTTSTTQTKSSTSFLISSNLRTEIPSSSAPKTPVTQTGGTELHANIAVSRRVKVFDVIESRFPASIQGDPSVTTDGNTSLASCVIINGTQPSWKVTLDKQHVIYGLKLYLPNSAHLTKFSVLIAGVFCYQRSSTVRVPTPYMFQCYEQMAADSVTVYVPQSDRTVSLALCEVEVYGKSTEQLDTDASPKTDDEGPPIAAIVVPCVIAVVIVVVVIAVVVIRRKAYLCVKSKDDPAEPHYAGLEPKTDENYSSLAPLPDRNVACPYENEEIQLEGRHTYVNSTELDE